MRVSILRVPGIYAADRLPLARLTRGTPALNPEDDAYVNSRLKRELRFTLRYPTVHHGILAATRDGAEHLTGKKQEA